MKKHSENMTVDIIHISKPKTNYQVMRDGSEEHWASYIASLARKGALLGDCGKMCTDCAFKYPQPLTQEYFDAVDGALKVILMGGIFNCHTDNHEDAGHICAGMAYANQYIETETLK